MPTELNERGLDYAPPTRTRVPLFPTSPFTVPSLICALAAVVGCALSAFGPSEVRGVAGVSLLAGPFLAAVGGYAAFVDAGARRLDKRLATVAMAVGLASVTGVAVLFGCLSPKL